MAESIEIKGLTPDENNTLKILTYFYFQMNHVDSANRGAKAILALNTKDIWAKAMLILCADNKEEYEKVLSLSDEINEFSQDKDIYRSVYLLRARALIKTGREAEANAMINNLREKV